MRQFLPSLLAGIAVTAALARPDRIASGVVLLPGLWSLLYGLGTVASLPYLPRLAAAVAAWYLLASWLLLSFVEGPVPSGWSVGLPFGVGQLLAAGVLYAKARLGLLVSLSARPGGLLFGELKELCSLTDGNLSRHLDVLAEAGLIEIHKGYDGRRPQTRVTLTRQGRKRFLAYLAELERVVQDARTEARRETGSQPGWVV
jgi:DNA-binding MarR family transcriptional regulator